VARREIGQGAEVGPKCAVRGQLAAKRRGLGVAGIRRQVGEEGREEGAEGLFAISKIPGTESKTKIFSLLLDSNEKLLNTIFVQFFNIYNFCFRHFFI
jgi:hypothetical protein